MHIQNQFEVIQTTFGKTLVAQDASVVHQDIHTAPLIHSLLDHGFHFVVIGHVGAIGNGLTAQSLYLSHHGQSRFTGAPRTVFGSTQIIDNNLGAALGQFDSMAAPETLACTGDNGDFAVITNTHYFNPLRKFFD